MRVLLGLTYGHSIMRLRHTQRRAWKRLTMIVFSCTFLDFWVSIWLRAETDAFSAGVPRSDLRCACPPVTDKPARCGMGLRDISRTTSVAIAAACFLMSSWLLTGTGTFFGSAVPYLDPSASIPVFRGLIDVGRWSLLLKSSSLSSIWKSDGLSLIIVCLWINEIRRRDSGIDWLIWRCVRHARSKGCEFALLASLSIELQEPIVNSQKIINKNLFIIRNFFFTDDRLAIQLLQSGEFFRDFRDPVTICSSFFLKRISLENDFGQFRKSLLFDGLSWNWRRAHLTNWAYKTSDTVPGLDLIVGSVQHLQLLATFYSI